MSDPKGTHSYGPTPIRAMGQQGNPRPLVVYLPGVSWNAVPGTDRRLAEQLVGACDVLWVDPPVSVLRVGRRGRGAGAKTPSPPTPATPPGLRRLTTLAAPGVTRPGLRRLAQASQERAVRRAVRRRGVLGVVVSDATRRFPSGVSGRRLYYVTDDWVAGASMMGLSSRAVERQQRINLTQADVVASVSPALADVLSVVLPARSVHVLPNGCDVEGLAVASLAAPVSAGAAPIAGLVGQLNERLDLSLLEAVADRGVRVVVAGPQTARDPGYSLRLRRWLDRDNVLWLGELPPAMLPELLSTFTVGLTPYADSPFNRASFPLKTLEYLAAGLPVVASDMPSVRWLCTPLVETAAPGPREYADLVVRRLANPRPEDRPARLSFAAQHSWPRRADELLDLLRVSQEGVCGGERAGE